MDNGALLTHAGGCHEDPGDDHLRDGLLCGLCRLAQAVPILVCDRNANFEFPREQNTCKEVHRRLHEMAGKR